MEINEIKKRIEEVYQELNNLKMESYDCIPEDYCCERMDYDTILNKAIGDYLSAKAAKELLSSLLEEIDE